MTGRLLRQSAKQPFEEVSSSEVEKIYIEQAVRAEWNATKHSLVMDSLNALGVRPDGRAAFFELLDAMARSERDAARAS